MTSTQNLDTRWEPLSAESVAELFGGTSARWWLSGGVALARGKRLAYLPQSADLDRSFPIHVYDLVAMGLWNRAGIFGRMIDAVGKVRDWWTGAEAGA